MRCTAWSGGGVSDGGGVGASSKQNHGLSEDKMNKGGECTQMQGAHRSANAGDQIVALRAGVARLGVVGQAGGAVGDAGHGRGNALQRHKSKVT